MSKFIEFFKSKKFIHTLILVCIFYVFSFLILMFCSQNSFLYARNDWVDANWYITMGRGLLKGKLPYKDLFEQKGPLLFFIFAIVALFKNPYIGTFIFETITLCILLCFVYKFAKNFLKRDAFSLVTALFMGIIITTTFAFSKGGGAVEEYALPIYMYLLLCLYEYVEGKQFSRTRSFLIGLWISVLFWVKYTLMLFPVFMLLVYLVLCLVRKEFKPLLKSILFMMFGFLSLSAVIILVFACAGGIKQLFTNYFYDNLFRYTKGYSISKVLLLLTYFKLNMHVFLLTFLGFLVYILKFKKKAIPLTVFAVLNILGLFIIAKSYYYVLPTCLFACFGIIMGFSFADKFEFKYMKFVYGAAAVLVFGISVLFGFLFSNVKHELSRPKEDYVEYKIARKIESYNLDEPTLLCYCYDYGFYTALGTVPSTRFYATNNFEPEAYPELYDSYKTYISEQTTDFLVTTAYYYEYEKATIDENYTLVEVYETYTWENLKENKQEFYLFIKNSLAK